MTSRLDYVDVAKGIATICVILGHLSVTPRPLVIWIYTFHIPLFFLLSGFVLNLDKYPTFLSFFTDKVKKLLIPYLWLSVLTWIWIYCVRDFSINKNSLIKFIGIFICAKDTPYYLSLWFIMSLFFSQILLYILLRCLSEKGKLIKICLCFVVGVFISSIYKPGWIWALDTVPMATFFLGLGYCLREKREKMNDFLQLKFFFVSFPLNVICGYFNFINHNRSDLFYQNIGQPILYVTSALFGIWMILILSKLIHHSKTLSYIGKNSLVFYAFHRPIFIPIVMKFLSLMSQKYKIFTHNMVQTLLSVFMICIGLFLLNELIDRYFPFILNKKRRKIEIKEL